MNTFIILLVIVGIIVLIAFVLHLASLKPYDVVSSAVIQNKSQDPNSVIYTVNPKPFPCIVCGCLTRINDTECTACGNTTS